MREKFKPPRTRSEAKRRGIMWYITGKECKNGHTSVRDTKYGKCRACKKAQRMRANPDAVATSDTRQRIEALKEIPDFEESWD